MKRLKTEVYSWRVSADVKAELDREAHRRDLSVAALLDLAVRELLDKSSAGNNGDVEQTRLRQAAAKCFGAFEGADPHRSENVRREAGQRLPRRNGR
jgi:hypothetical protein